MATTTEPTGHGPGARSRTDDVIVAATLGAIVLWRFWVLARHVEPVGLDVANWVRISRSWWGPVDVDDVVIPPVAPLIAGVTSEVLSLRWTSHVLMSSASVAPALGAWIVLRKRSRGSLAIGAVGAIALAGSTSAAMAWGGLAQLLGLGALMVVADRVDRFADEPTRRSALVAGVWLAVLAATSALVLVAGLLVVGSMSVVALVRHGREAARHVVWIAAPSLPFVPLYLVMVSRMSISADAATAIGVGAAVETVLGPTVWPWIIVAGAGGYGLVRQRRREDGANRWVLPIVLVAGAAVPVGAGELRFAYVLPVAIVVAVVILLEGTTAVPRFVALVAVVAIAVTGPGSQRRDVDFYAQLVPDGVGTAIEWLDQNADDDALVLVAPVNGAPFGWTVEAAGIDALVASRDDWLFFPGERAGSDRAVELLSGERWPTGLDLARIRAEGIDWVFVPVAWRGQDDRSVDDIERRCPESVPYRTESTIVLRTDDPCGRR